MRLRLRASGIVLSACAIVLFALPAHASSARLTFYWPCNLIEIPGLEALKDSADIFVDEKRVGNISTCEYTVIEVPPGARKLSVRLQLPLFDLLPPGGAEYSVKPGQEWYFRLSRSQYVEWNEVPARVGRQDVSQLKRK